MLSLVLAVAQLGLEPCPVEAQGKWGGRGVFPCHMSLAALSPHPGADLGSGIVPCIGLPPVLCLGVRLGGPRAVPVLCRLTRQRTALRSEAALKSLGPRRSSFSGPQAEQVWFTGTADKHAPRWVRRAGAGPHGDVQSRARGNFPRNAELNFSIISINNYYLLRAHRRP